MDSTYNSPPSSTSYLFGKHADVSFVSLASKPAHPDFFPSGYTVGPASPLYGFEESRSSVQPSTPPPATTSVTDIFYQEKEVPEVQQVNYLVVNPCFPSLAPPQTCLRHLGAVMDELEFKYEVLQGWQMSVTGMLCAEEVNFVLAVRHAQGAPECLQIDFFLQEGVETNFLRLFDIIRSKCSCIDQDAIDNTLRPPPKVKEWLNVDAFPEVFPGSGCVPADVMVDYCTEYIDLVATGLKDSRSLCARLEMAKTIKNCCIIEKNRDTILKTPDLLEVFSKALGHMVADSQMSLGRYAVFILNLFDGISIGRIKERVDIGGFRSVISSTSASDSIPRMQSIASTLRRKMDL
ncbi:hypothetical protein ACHHYP_03064 [Achlya hypogyna]|uniref:Uncharacterized protein n=1 Tax=Achlya hypogyna TaxID=1202772 RepID=A0A1V9Z4J6_ACHHY|nr:hypothetical protein ACHHYP_03064 [Achlya hypogyna]